MPRTVQDGMTILEQAWVRSRDLLLTSSESKLFNSLIGGGGRGTVFSGTLIKYLMLQLNFVIYY